MQRDFKGLSEELELWGDTNDTVSILPCGVFLSVGQNIPFERQEGKNVFLGGQGLICGGMSLILLPVCTRSVSFSPLYSEKFNRTPASLLFNKILVQILTSWGSLNTSFSIQVSQVRQIHLCTVGVTWRRFEIQLMGLASLSWWGTSLSWSAPQFSCSLWRCVGGRKFPERH